MKQRKALFSFVWYCFRHPSERFWQSLRNWSNADFIYGQRGGNYLALAQDEHQQTISVFDTWQYNDKLNK